MSLNLWVETTISGFIYLSAFFFFGLGWARVKDLSFLSATKDYSSLVVVVVTIASYIVGLLMLRVTQGFFRRPVKWIATKFKMNNFLSVEDNSGNRYYMEAVVNQYGSSRLHQELSYQYNNLVLFSLLISSLPLLGLGLAFWLSTAGLHKWATPAGMVGILLGIVSAYVAVRQRRHLSRLREQAFNVASHAMNSKS